MALFLDQPQFVSLWVAVVAGLPPTLLALATLITSLKSKAISIENGKKADHASSKAADAVVKADVIAATLNENTNVTQDIATTLNEVRSNTNGTLGDLRNEVKNLRARLDTLSEARIQAEKAHQCEVKSIQTGALDELKSEIKTLREQLDRLATASGVDGSQPEPGKQ
jgi:DNA repair exonuclease SbcCD ATPase subunit